MNAVMGVDPGVNGGVAVLDRDGRLVFVRGFRDDMKEGDIVAIVNLAVNILSVYGGREGYFEKVHHMTGDGAQGSHTFGYIKGLLRGVLLAQGVRLYDVSPQLWQSKLACMTGGDKNVSKRRAIELFPGVKVTHAIADAMLIALYGRLSGGSGDA